MSIDEIRGRLEAATPGPWGMALAANADNEPTATRQDKAEFLELALNDDESPLFLVTNDEVIPAVTGDGPNAEANAEFIAHAPEDMRRLLNAIEAVLALHYEGEESEEILPMSCVDGPCEHDDDICPEVTIMPCAECSTPGEMYYEWPCPTVKAITSALEAKP